MKHEGRQNASNQMTIVFCGIRAVFVDPNAAGSLRRFGRRYRGRVKRILGKVALGLSTDAWYRPGTKRQWPLGMCRVEGQGLCGGCSGRVVSENTGKCLKCKPAVPLDSSQCTSVI